MHFPRKPLQRLGIVLFEFPPKVVAFSTGQLTASAIGRDTTGSLRLFLFVTPRLFSWAITGAVRSTTVGASYLTH